MDALPAGGTVALPTGTVTFVFTDIEGSTQRWDRGRAAMQDAVRRHDALLREIIGSHQGRVFKTVGDQFCAAFERPETAIAAMLAALRALAAEDFSKVDGLRIRVAIHSGTADERDGDYFGPALNRVARILAIGHGGQVLVSGVARDLAEGGLPSGARLRDLGEHRLRDLSRPEHVFQLAVDDLVSEFPPLRSLDVLKNNLPRVANSIIGRETEIADIAVLIEQHTLVTIIGSGGVGKTRTSLQVGANLLTGSGDGVWFIELAPLTHAEYIPSTIAQALSLRLPLERDPLDALTEALASKHALLIFDNCEHLVAEASRVIGAILDRCPQIHVLGSSREALGLDGEVTYWLPSLSFPDSSAPQVTSADCARYTAIALFMERARANDSRFEISDENAPIIADICRRLDGIPLAIELAASRVKVLGPRQVRDRLNERFRVLTSGRRDVLPRQQTLRALIDWSHDLLDDRERVLFRRMGIFTNGFTLEGATAAGSDENLDEFEVIDILARLVEKSLVLAEPHGDSMRYRLLESTRAYAAEKLADAVEYPLTATRHLNYLRVRFEEIRAREQQTARETELHDAFATELEDVRAALDGALARYEIVAGASLLAAIRKQWAVLGLTGEGVARNDAFLAALPPDELLIAAHLSTTIASLFEYAPLMEPALERAAQAVTYARASGGGSELGAALHWFAWFNIRLGRLDDAQRALDEAAATPSLPAPLRLQQLTSRGILSAKRGDRDAAIRIYEQLRTEHRALGNTRGEQIVVLNLAEDEHARGQTQRAISLVRDILPEARRSADKPLLASLLGNLAGYLVAVDDLDEAEVAAREAIGLLGPTEPDHGTVALSLEPLALVYALRRDFVRAAMLEGYADAAIRKRGAHRDFTEITTHDRLRGLLAEELTPEVSARLAGDGAGLTPSAAVALAIEQRMLRTGTG